jgi:hypothetical protein
MSDVAAKCINNNVVKFGNVVAGALPTGRFSSYNETHDDSKAMQPSGLFNRLGNRFDDVRYYSGDTAA